MKSQKISRRLPLIIVSFAMSLIGLSPVMANPQKNSPRNFSNQKIINQISNNICKDYIIYLYKYNACNRLVVSGISALNSSRLNPIGVNLRNDSQFQAYLEKAGDVLTQDNSFISSFTFASDHLTKQETSDIYLSIIIAYSAFKNQGY